MNLTSNVNGATLTARMAKATKMAKRLKWMPIPREAKNKIVMCNILPAALYGVEITSINKAAMQELRSAIASAIGPASAKRSVDMVFNTTSTAKDLDSKAHCLYLRAANLRRIMAKNVNAQNQVWKILEAYNQYGMEGQEGTPINLERQIKLMETQTKYKKSTIWQSIARNNATGFGSSSETVGHPSLDEAVSSDNVANNPEEKAFGPVGLLIQQLHECGYRLNNQMVASAPGEVDVDIWNMPWQHLKPAILAIAIRKRNAEINATRTFCGSIEEIDTPIIKQ